MPFVQFGIRTGEVWIRDFDLGIVKTMGGVLQTDTGATGGGGYVLGVPGVCAPDGSNNVPIIFNNPEQVFSQKVYPSILVTRPDMTPANQRWHSIGQLEYRVAASGASIVSGIGPGGAVVTGYTEIESKVQAMPFDIPYEIQIVSKFENEAQVILRKLLRVFKPYSKIEVIDSLGDTRTYSAQMDGGVSKIDEFQDTQDRLKGYQISLLVEGELDLSDPETSETASGFSNTVGRKA